MQVCKSVSMAKILYKIVQALLGRLTDHAPEIVPWLKGKILRLHFRQLRLSWKSSVCVRFLFIKRFYLVVFI